MAIITKTQGTTLLALQSVAANSVVIGTPLDVSTRFSGMVGFHFGRRAATILTAGVELRIDASMKATGDDQWFPLVVFKTSVVVSEAEPVTGTVAAGTNVITVASTTNFSVDDVIYIDNPVIANSTWGRIKAVNTNVSVTIEDNLANAQTGATIYDQGELFIGQLDLSAIGRIRAVANGNNSGQLFAVEAYLVTADSVG